MAQLRHERGVKPTGRPRIEDKYKRQIVAAEKAFADSMAEAAQLYVGTLLAVDPEVCDEHKLVLECPNCGAQSQRRDFDHKAAAYAFDRIMGKPTARTESTLPATFVDQVVEAVTTAFLEVNAINDPLSRQSTFAQRLESLRLRVHESAA